MVFANDEEAWENERREMLSERKRELFGGDSDVGCTWTG